MRVAPAPAAVPIATLAVDELAANAFTIPPAGLVIANDDALLGDVTFSGRLAAANGVDAAVVGVAAMTLALRNNEQAKHDGRFQSNTAFRTFMGITNMLVI